MSLFSPVQGLCLIWWQQTGAAVRYGVNTSNKHRPSSVGFSEYLTSLLNGQCQEAKKPTSQRNFALVSSNPRLNPHLGILSWCNGQALRLNMSNKPCPFLSGFFERLTSQLSGQCQTSKEGLSLRATQLLLPLAKGHPSIRALSGHPSRSCAHYRLSVLCSQPLWSRLRSH